MPTVREETYTTAQPDGTLMTTVAKTRTQYVYGDNEIRIGRGPISKRYLRKPSVIVRAVEVVLGLVIVALIVSVYGPGPFKGVLFGQTFLLMLVGIAICVSFIFLVVYFFKLNETHLDFWPWQLSDFTFSLAACVLLLAMAFVEAYYATGAWANNCNDIGSDGIIHNGCRTIHQWAFAAFLCFVNAILYGISAFFARQ